MSYEFGKGNNKQKTEYHSLDSLFGETMHSAKKGEIRPMSTRPQNGTHQYIFISSQKEGKCAVTHNARLAITVFQGLFYNSFHWVGIISFVEYERPCSEEEDSCKESTFRDSDTLQGQEQCESQKYV